LDYTTTPKIARTKFSEKRIERVVGGFGIMNIIKIILAVLGVVFGVIVFFWLLGIISSLLWYGFWIGLLAAVGYGGYRMFKKAESLARRRIGERT